MPQLDMITFFSQIFWLTVTFYGFYFFILRIYLPKIAVVLKTRKKKLLLGSTGVYRYNDNLINEKKVQNNLFQIFVEDLFNKFSKQESKWVAFTLLKIKVFTNFYTPLIELQQTYYFDSIFLIKKYINNL